MADLDVLHKAFGLFQRHVQTADAVAGIAVNALEAPFRQTVPNEFADVHAHVRRPNLEPRAIVPIAATLHMLNFVRLETLHYRAMAIRHRLMKTVAATIC